MLIVDAHEDIAYNMFQFRRDYSLSAAEIRELEHGTTTPSRNGQALLGWPEYQRGQVAVVFATLFNAPRRMKTGEWEQGTYATPEEAHRLYWRQLDAYHRLVDRHPDKFRLVLSKKDLDEVLDDWKQEPSTPAEGEGSRGHPVGLVLLMEGAEGVRHPEELEEWWERGLRIVGPAWAGTRFCGGTREPGPLTLQGYALLEAMADMNFILDISHADEEAVLQCLDRYPGQIIASHSNAMALLKGLESNRHLSDRVIAGLIEREGVIGVLPWNKALKAGWTPSDGRAVVSLRDAAAHIDHICQIAGDARHVGLGSDYDGGFGLDSVPVEVDSIADLQKIGPILAEKGYTEADIAGVLGENWLSVLRKILPEEP